MEEWLRSEWEEFRLRMENADRKRQMEDELGAHFGAGDGELDPALESEWLNQLEMFEDQFENARSIPLRQYLGYPSVKACADVSDDALEEELKALLGLMTENGVALDTICEVTDRELYRFIVEELLDEEIDDIRISGMTRHYIYEEFHPNDIYDITEAVKSLVHDLLQSAEEFQEYTMDNFSRERSFTADGQPQTWEELEQRIDRWFLIRPAIASSEVEVLAQSIDGDDAHVEANVRWSTTAGVVTQGRAACWLTRSPYGGWDVVQAKVPGVPL